MDHSLAQVHGQSQSLCQHRWHVRHVRGINTYKKKDKKKSAFQESSVLQLWSARACLLKSFLKVPTELLRGRKPCLEKLPDDETWGCRAPSNHTVLCLLKVHLQGGEQGWGCVCTCLCECGGRAGSDGRFSWMLINTWKHILWLLLLNIHIFLYIYIYIYMTHRIIGGKRPLRSSAQHHHAY